jgi:hypothetical protein
VCVIIVYGALLYKFSPAALDRGYTSAILATQYACPLWVNLPLGMLVAGVVAMPVALVMLRTVEDYFREPLKIHISSQLLRCGKNFLLAYNPYAARRNFSRALHLGEL